MPAIIEVKYFNTFLLKKIPRSATGVTENYGESPDGRYPVFPGTPEWNVDGLSWPNSAISPVDDITLKYSWFLEESRIRGGYNNASVDFGVRAYTTEDEINQQRFNSIIYSGVYNSRTGVNETNVFSIGESIVKSLDPTNGSIQKLYAEDTNLIIFQENRKFGHKMSEISKRSQISESEFLKYFNNDGKLGFENSKISKS